MVIIIGGHMFGTTKRIIECRECPWGCSKPYKNKYTGHEGFLVCCTSSTPGHLPCEAARWACDLKTVTL